MHDLGHGVRSTHPARHRAGTSLVPTHNFCLQVQFHSTRLHCRSLLPPWLETRYSDTHADAYSTGDRLRRDTEVALSASSDKDGNTHRIDCVSGSRHSRLTIRLYPNILTTNAPGTTFGALPRAWRHVHEVLHGPVETSLSSFHLCSVSCSGDHLADSSGNHFGMVKMNPVSAVARH